MFFGGFFLIMLTQSLIFVLVILLAVGVMYLGDRLNKADRRDVGGE
jgi:hypothetical protein